VVTIRNQSRSDPRRIVRETVRRALVAHPGINDLHEQREPNQSAEGVIHAPPEVLVMESGTGAARPVTPRSVEPPSVTVCVTIWEVSAELPAMPEPRSATDDPPPPILDAPGDSEPGFRGEGHRSELGDGNPIDPVWRERFAEHNRQVALDEAHAKAAKKGPLHKHR
jgi:hypothetical protein